MAYMEKNLLAPYQPPYHFYSLLLCGRVFEAALRANFMAFELSLLIAVPQKISAAGLSIRSWSGMASASSLNSVLFALALLASVSHLVPGSSSMVDLL